MSLWRDEVENSNDAYSSLAFYTLPYTQAETPETTVGENVHVKVWFDPLVPYLGSHVAARQCYRVFSLKFLAMVSVWTPRGFI